MIFNAMNTDDTDSPGIPSSGASRKRRKESPESRRLKGRARKRRKRAALPAIQTQVAGNSSSSSEQGFDAETGQFPPKKLFRYDAEALARLQQRVVAGGRPIPHVYREFTSAIPEPSSSRSNNSDTEEEGGPVGAGVDSDGETFDNTETARNLQRNPENVAEPAAVDGGSPAGEQEENEAIHENSEVTVRNPADDVGDSGEQEHAGTNHDDALEEEDMEGNPHGNTEVEEMILRRQLRNMTDMERLAIDTAGVRGSSCASNASLDKLFRVVLKHLETVRKLQRKGNKDKIYSKKLRRLAVKYVPKVTTDLLLEVKDPDGSIEYKRLEGLTAIPDEYRRHDNKRTVRVIREESSVSLQDIKAHHERVHVKNGHRLEDIRKEYGNCILSLDGVEESHSGQKKFHVGSIKIGDCIYPYKVYDFLMGHEAAKVSTSSMIG